jgi:hypothetical protein
VPDLGEHPLLGRLVEQRPGQPAHHRVDVHDAALGEELAEVAGVAVDDLEPGPRAAEELDHAFVELHGEVAGTTREAARRSRRSPRPCPGPSSTTTGAPAVGTIEASTAESRVELGTTAPIVPGLRRNAARNARRWAASVGRG